MEDEDEDPKALQRHCRILKQAKKQRLVTQKARRQAWKHMKHIYVAPHMHFRQKPTVPDAVNMDVKLKHTHNIFFPIQLLWTKKIRKRANPQDLLLVLKLLFLT